MRWLGDEKVRHVLPPLQVAFDVWGRRKLNPRMVIVDQGEETFRNAKIGLELGQGIATYSISIARIPYRSAPFGRGTGTRGSATPTFPERDSG